MRSGRWQYLQCAPAAGTGRKNPAAGELTLCIRHDTCSAGQFCRVSVYARDNYSKSRHHCPAGHVLAAHFIRISLRDGTVLQGFGLCTGQLLKIQAPLSRNPLPDCSFQSLNVPHLVTILRYMLMFLAFLFTIYLLKQASISAKHLRRRQFYA